jgi:hypothetical protein
MAVAAVLAVLQFQMWAAAAVLAFLVVEAMRLGAP